MLIDFCSCPQTSCLRGKVVSVNFMFIPLCAFPSSEETATTKARILNLMTALSCFSGKNLKYELFPGRKEAVSARVRYPPPPQPLSGRIWSALCGAPAERGCLWLSLSATDTSLCLRSRSTAPSPTASDATAAGKRQIPAEWPGKLFRQLRQADAARRGSSRVGPGALRTRSRLGEPRSRRGEPHSWRAEPRSRLREPRSWLKEPRPLRGEPHP